MPNDSGTLVRRPLNCIAAALALCFCALFGDHANSQVTTSPSASQTPSNDSRGRHTAKGTLVPYHGIISAVDKDAKTFTIEGRRGSRVLKIIDGTSITKDRETATIDDISKDEEVRGSYLKGADGTLLVRSVKIGPVKRKTTPTPTASPTP